MQTEEHKLIKGLRNKNKELIPYRVELISYLFDNVLTLN